MDFATVHSRIMTALAPAGASSVAVITKLAGGAPINCTVIVRQEVEERPENTNYRITDKNPLIEILRADYADPVKGDRVAITGGNTYQIASIQNQDEWVTTVRAGVVR